MSAHWEHALPCDALDEAGQPCALALGHQGDHITAADVAAMATGAGIPPHVQAGRASAGWNLTTTLLSWLKSLSSRRSRGALIVGVLAFVFIGWAFAFCALIVTIVADALGHVGATKGLGRNARLGIGFAVLIAIVMVSSLTTDGSQPLQVAQAMATSQPPTVSPSVGLTAAPTATPTPTLGLTPTPTLAPTPALIPTNDPAETLLWPGSGRYALGELVSLLPLANEVRLGYERSLFPHWIDADGDGCHTRREVLIVEALVAPILGADCSIYGGQWRSLYDEIVFSDASDLDVDHVVALAEAWDSGAHEWAPDRRTRFANDLEAPWALIAVSAASNRTKSDQDPSQWLPPSAAFRCTYASMWVAVKARWWLTIDAAEQAALQEVATSCLDQQVEFTIAP